ncbi:arylesterase [Methylocystis sp. B8]|uniref:arylesterase n=1 Tax=Methylocystis sp. B8 TaxID=544938 RepID=UPI0010FF2117|nr:arylesterase [Methylocystis sp. B8]TLG75212.1 arylesterase [Methylocystis sp. B8]
MIDAPHSTPEVQSLYCAFRRPLQVAATAVLALFTLAVAPAQAAPVRILAFGDSLTAGAGVAAEDSLPAQLKRRLSEDGFDVEVVQGGVSGDTTTTGLARLEYTLGAGPFDIAVVELGANDMLNGHDPKVTRANLDQILATLKQKGVRPVLTAMVSSANHGQAYKRDFDSIYPNLAAKHEAPLVPFILEGVWGSPALLIGDGVHPNAAGVAKIVKKLAPYVEKTLVSMGASKTSRAQ